MIKFIYEGKSYNFEHVGCQNYDINTEIVMNEDCSIVDIMEAIVKLTKIAGFHGKKENFINAIEDVFGDED